jgi:hypothetical protein
LLVCGSARNDGTCPGENSKAWRLTELARKVVQAAGMEANVLGLSLVTSEYGRTIHPCKGCASTAMPWCHWPCSCYPNHALGQSDVAGVEEHRRNLCDWLELMGLVDAGPAAKLDRDIGYFEPYYNSHDTLDQDLAVQKETQNVARAVVQAVTLVRAGELSQPDKRGDVAAAEMNGVATSHSACSAVRQSRMCGATCANEQKLLYAKPKVAARCLTLTFLPTPSSLWRSR